MISPIGGIEYNGKLHVFHSETEVGPITQKLYKELTGVQIRRRRSARGLDRQGLIPPPHRKTL